MTPQTYHEEVALKFGFRPYEELSPEQQISVDSYVDKHYFERIDPKNYFWKESSVGDGNWISYYVQTHNRIAAPHLRRDQ
jgi:hypothetical protein